MARSYLISALLASVLLLFAATSRSDSGSGLSTTPGAGDPPPPSVPTPGHQPFTPYDPGPPDTIWQYSQLTPAEQAVVDNASDTNDWDAVQAGFASAAAQLAQQAQQQAAQLQIGLEGLASAGVIQ